MPTKELLHKYVNLVSYEWFVDDFKIICILQKHTFYSCENVNAADSAYYKFE